MRARRNIAVRSENAINFAEIKFRVLAGLSFWRGLAVINAGTVTKRLTISLLLLVLALAIASNRLLSLRQVAVTADSRTTVHQPLDNLIRSDFTGKFLVPESMQDEFQLQKLAPTSLQTALDIISDSWHLPRLESNAFPKSPPYISLSVLNL
jgi:hypothetical protein